MPKGQKGLPRDPVTGKVKRSRGRPKNSLNKTTIEVKEALSWCFEKMGGREKLLTWAKANQTTFYTKMYIQMLPMTIQGKINATVTDGDERKLLATTMVDALTRIIAARQSGSEGVGVIIDNTANEESVPQLVFSRKTGTETT